MMMNDEVRKAKLDKRRAERVWRNSSLEINRQIYMTKRDELNHAIFKAKHSHIQASIGKCNGQQKELFKRVDELFYKKKSSSLPTHESVDELCNRMADFFDNKIKDIYNGLAAIQQQDIQLDPDTDFPSNGTCLQDFEPLSEEDIEEIVKQSASKSCCLDPIPTQLIKECLDVLLPIITRIVNASFASSSVPHAFKIAAVTPILKKANLIAEILKNFRPISNLPYLSKVLEKAASKQLLVHKTKNNVREKFQSAYRENHSTETALLRIQHDLLSALDRKQCVFMVMLDLSAAFDTVNHSKLLGRLDTSLGVRGNALKWLKSYLTGRRQFVTIQRARSKEVIKTCDVPQGSILGPNLYEDYTSGPVGAIFRKHGIQYHIYADDTQAYISFDAADEQAALAKLEICLKEVRQWMAANWLKLNDTKTEFIVFGNKSNLDELKTDRVTLGDASIEKVDRVKSIGATLDRHMKLDSHTSSICKSAWFHLHQISKIKLFLTHEQLKSVIHAYVVSRLDQNNSLLIGLPKDQITKLQMVQNAAARLLYGARKRDHVTPLLIKLHWLPVEKRILFKILLLVYKCTTGKGPDYLTELLVTYKPTRQLRSSTQLLLTVPTRHYADTRRRDFAHIGPVEWNKLPMEIRSSCSTDSFKRCLKTYLFKCSYL